MIMLFTLYVLGQICLTVYTHVHVVMAVCNELVLLLVMSRNGLCWKTRTGLSWSHSGELLCGTLCNSNWLQFWIACTGTVGIQNVIKLWKLLYSQKILMHKNFATIRSTRYM